MFKGKKKKPAQAVQFPPYIFWQPYSRPLSGHEGPSWCLQLPQVDLSAG